MNSDNNNKQKFELLKDVFGYSDFRPYQSEIIDCVLQKKDTLAIIPTGGGKSLCYQIPALMFNGITLVISPLISLMKDQTDQLKELGIKSVFLNSSLLREDYSITLQKVLSGLTKLVYVAPEALNSSRINNLLANINVDLITVDEAHCISEWGHDFRKEYRNITCLREKCPNASFLAVTATATKKVRTDIIHNLQFKKSSEFVASFNRENLFLDVQPKINPELQTVEFLEKFPNQSGIIYCYSRAQVEDLAQYLQNKGYSVKPYHAGLDDKIRKQNQELFINDDVKIIVATIAFGMGINKPNVRFVIHFDLPKSIESYYQEIGRSGRDGMKAHCLFLFRYGDTKKIEYFIEQIEDDKNRGVAQAHLDAMVNFAQSMNCRRGILLKYFGEKYNEEYCGMCNNCIGSDVETTDLSIEAKKFLSCVKRTGEIFGTSYIIDVLRGSESERIIKNQHDKISTWGIGKEYSKKQWHHFAHQLIQQEFVKKTQEYSSLKLTPKAWDLFKDNITFIGLKEIVKTDYSKARIEDMKYDDELYNLLKSKRKYLSDKYGIPPYAIFPDKTLIEMATYFPKSKNSLIKIYGVGKFKYIKYGEIFLALIRNYCNEKSISEISQITGKNMDKNKPENNKEYKYQKIGKEFDSGLTIWEIAQKYLIKEQTVHEHLYKNMLNGKFFEPNKIRKNIKLEQKDIDLLFNSFDIWGCAALKSIFEEHQEKYSYNEISLARLYYLCLHPEEIEINDY